MKKLIPIFTLILLLVGCGHAPISSPNNSNSMTASSAAHSADDSADPRLWLEDINSPKALEQVKKWNDPTLAELQGDPRYKGIESGARKIMLAEDRIPYGSIRGEYVYNFWQDKKNVRGLWRRTKLGEYSKKNPKWETILDLDKLSANEKENWVWKGMDCLMPEATLCIVTLSRGGQDASVLREFDVASKSFVMGGFALPEAKSSSAWVDKDTLLIATDTGAGSLTKSGYPRQVRKWARGTPYIDAPIVFSATEDDIGASMFVAKTPTGTMQVITREKTFFTSESHLLKDNGQLLDIPVPEFFHIMGVYHGRIIGKVRKDWAFGGQVFKNGSLLAYPTKDLPTPARPELIYEPNDRSSVEATLETRSHLYLQVNVNVIGQILRADLTADSGGTPKWNLEKVPMPGDGSVSLIAGNSFQDIAMVGYAGFLIPDTVYLLQPKGQNSEVTPLRSLPKRFDSSGLVVEQFETPSRDGVRIPYFVIHRKDMKMNAANPTLLYGYGGFELSITPSYLGAIGRTWSEKGGVYVLANIRGGGEFGPAWHDSARLKNRQKVYDDFIAVAEDLIRKKITAPRHLGIMGGSNGGLMVGSVFVERPGLFNAVVCQVPLLDMLRYHKLLAGASWMDEYGNPDDPEMAAVIRQYSPYQNLKPGVKYPRVLFMTSTRDDRVHPGHARKMAAKMEEYGEPFLYFENTEGGHGAAANLEQRIRFFSLEWTYLWKQLR
jgi:prolyl oligopeptidase